MSHLARTITLVMSLAIIGASVSAAVAETKWQNNHPGRTNLNAKLNNENRQIHQERKAGELTPAQANALHRDVHAVRQDERGMARQDHNNGHITGTQFKSLNQQNNTLNAEIRGN